MSSRLAAVLGSLIAVLALTASSAAAKPASFRSRVKQELRRELHRNPGVIRSKSFLRRAALVDFRLPVTVVLRGANTNSNPNSAGLGLGTTLGSREVNVGGSLSAEVIFKDSKDGGALGNVGIRLLPSSKSLRTTSVPLLWSPQISDPTTSWDSSLIGPSAGYPNPGCGNVQVVRANALGNLPFGVGALPSTGGPGLPGVPIYPDDATYAAHGTPVAYAPAHVASAGTARNDINGVQAGGVTGDHDIVGANPDPFPVAASHDPGADGTSGQPTAADTMLRTNALALRVASPGTVAPSVGPQGSDTVVMGASEGEANLFGNIPGKSVGADITVSLTARVWTIVRYPDQDSTAPLIVGQPWPAGVFPCEQLWTGYVDNAFPGIRLQGSIKVTPGITADGKLRIAKATLSQHAPDDSGVAVSACVVPYAEYHAERNNSDTTTPAVPAGPLASDGSLALSALPYDPDNIRQPPDAPCASAPTALVAGMPGQGRAIAMPTPATGTSGYTSTVDGTRVSLAGALHITNVSADVVLGDQ